MKKNDDLVGKKFGRLTVIEEAGRDKNRKIIWKCLCDCGNEATIIGSCLKCGDTKSCGCYQKEIQANRLRKHGLKDHPLYQTLVDMKQRCYNKSNDCYRWYGEKGITVCQEWADNVELFIKWALANGWKKGLTIDRIDSSGNYEPSNCQFLTRSENSIKMLDEHYPNRHKNKAFGVSDE